MKAYLTLAAICLCYATLAWGQSSSLIRVKHTEDLKNAVPIKDKYRYPKFQTGTISFYNGTTIDTRLNYNSLLKEMQFLTTRGDTMALANEYTIKKIDIGNNQFLYAPKVGFVEVVNTFEDIKLATLLSLIQVRSEKMGGYNQSSGASSITRFKTYTDHNGKVQQLDVKGDILLAKKEDYYLVDKNNTVLPANRATVLKLFPDHKKEIGDYIKKNNTNFTQISELTELLQYSSTLAAR